MSHLEALKNTLAFVKAFPEKHDQEIWHCETSACIAGHASLLNGASLQTSAFGTHLVDNETGRVVAAAEYARTVLGLTWVEADYIFYCMDNEIAVQRLEQIVELKENGETFDYEEHWIHEPDSYEDEVFDEED